MSDSSSVYRSMSILHTVKDLSLESGGLSSSVLRLVQSIADHSSDNHIIVAAQGGQSSLVSKSKLKENLTWKQLSNKKYSTQLVKILDSACLSHAQELESFLFHDHGLWLPLNHEVAVEAKKRRVPRIVSTHGMLSPWAMKHRAWKKKIAWMLYQHKNLKEVDVLHATSKTEALILQDMFPKVPVALIPLGVDLPPPPIRPVKFSERRRKILFLSRLHPVKGLPNLIQAFADQDTDRWELIIAGPDEDNHQAEVEQLVYQLGLEESVKFIGSVQDESKWNLYQQADIFALPSFTENFGLVVVEALAHCVPVITTKGTPWSELVSNKCGWWIDGNVEALTHTLRQAIRLSDDERLAMGQRGYQLVAQKYTWQRSAEKMVALYTWLLGTGSQPDCILESCASQRPPLRTFK